MILSPNQKERFYSIFNPFIAFARDRLLELGALPEDTPASGTPDILTVKHILDAIWGEGGHIEVIDEFVERNVSFPSDALEVLEGWKQGLHDTFFATRRGHDTLFVTGECAFAVHGITQEVDDGLADLPTFVTTVIVPYDGVITYLVCIVPTKIQLDVSAVKSYLQEVEEMEAANHLARTAEQFELLAPLARETRQKDIEERERRRHDTELYGDDVLEGQHVSLFAKSDDETSELLEQVRDRMIQGLPTFISDTIDAICVKGRPTASLKRIIGRLNVSELRNLVTTNHEKRMKKAQLQALIEKRCLEKAARMAQDGSLMDSNTAKGLRTLIEAGGTLRVDRNEQSGLLSIPLQDFPLITYFRDGDDYVIVVPDECRSLFCDMDWDRIELVSSGLDDACAYLGFSCDARGLIALDEAVEAVAERFGNLDETMLRRSIERGDANPVVELDGKAYVVAPDLMVAQGKKMVLDVATARAHLEDQVGRPAYWPTIEEARYGDLLGMALSIDEGKALMGFLENHIPDGENDLLFPTMYMAEVVSFHNSVLDPQDQVNWMTDLINEVAFDINQGNRVAQLIIALTGALPKRTLNGWIPTRYEAEVEPRDPRNLMLFQGGR